MENKLKLTVNRKKSKVTSVYAIRNFKFLGFALGRNGNGTYIRVHPKSWKKMKARLKSLSSRRHVQSVIPALDKIRLYMRGWLNYYGIAAMKQAIKELNGWLYHRIRMCIWKMWKRPRSKIVVVKLFCNICGLNLLDCCLEAIGTVRFYQWCFAPLRGHAIDKICHFRFFAITQSNQETCFRRPLCCCPHLVWCAVTVIAMWAHMIVGSIGEFLHRVIEFLFRPKFVQIRAFVL